MNDPREGPGVCDHRPVPEPEMVLPDYTGRATTSIVPALTWGSTSPLVPADVAAADQAVLLVLDSLGWEQLHDNADVAPTLASMPGQAATTVAPSTTAAALTSISTGLPPGEHGVVGYRFPAGGAVMNALRWTTTAGDHRQTVPPTSVQAAAPFAGGRWVVVGNRAFATSAFTEAHLGDAPYAGYDHPSSIIPEVRSALAGGAPLVYAYYDGLDHVAHVHGVSGEYYRHELAFCDWLVGGLLAALPSGTALMVTADHGHVDAPDLVGIAAEVDELVVQRSGEPRFRWLHSRPAGRDALLEAAGAAHADQAWVMPADEVIERGILGPVVTDAARSRIGDVALIAHAPIGFSDPAERRAEFMVGRHGSLTAAEMLVPALGAVV